MIPNVQITSKPSDNEWRDATEQKSSGPCDEEAEMTLSIILHVQITRTNEASRLSSSRCMACCSYRSYLAKLIPRIGVPYLYPALAIFIIL